MAENQSFEVKQKIPKYATILTKLQTHVATTLGQKMFFHIEGDIFLYLQQKMICVL